MDTIKQTIPHIDTRDRSGWRKKSKVTDRTLLTREVLLVKIGNYTSYATIRDRCLIAFLYLTACRISEAVKDVVPAQIVFEEHKGKTFIVVRAMNCLKRRPNNKAERDVVIDPIADADFVTFLMDYINTIPPEDADKPLFNFGRHMAYHIVRRLDDKLFPHYFRHLRCSDLARQGLNSADLRQFVGWTNDSPASKYVHLNWKDTASKMMNN